MKIILYLMVFLLLGTESVLAKVDKVELGKMLFFDARLSKDGTISCNSCHSVMSGGTDNRSFSMGVKGHVGGRNAPTVLNAKFLSVQFWDGRAKDLAEQAKGPLINPLEMGDQNHQQVVARLKKIPGYVKYFKKVYRGDITIDRLADAIAAYESTLTTLNSPFDKFKAGDKKALSKLQLKGWEKFQSVGCISCHSGEHFAGPQLPTGVGFFQKFPVNAGTGYDKKYFFSKDLGRYDVTKKEVDRHLFRVPTLRNIAITAPYFHNGAVDDLAEAVRVMAKAQLDKVLAENDVNEIVAFLKSLTGHLKDQSLPQLPPTPGSTVYSK